MKCSPADIEKEFADLLAQIGGTSEDSLYEDDNDVSFDEYKHDIEWGIRQTLWSVFGSDGGIDEAD